MNTEMNTKEAITQEMLFRPEDSQGLGPFLAGAAVENLSKLIEEVNYNIEYYKEVGKETLQRAKKEPLRTTAGTLVALNLLIGACSKPIEDVQEPTPITEVLPTRTPTVSEPTREPTKTPSPSPTEAPPTPEPEPTLAPTIVPEYPTFGVGGEYPEELREIEDVLRQEENWKKWVDYLARAGIFHPETDELKYDYEYEVDEQGNVIEDRTLVLLEAIEGEYKGKLISRPIDIEQAEGKEPGDLPPVFQETPPEREGEAEFVLSPDDPTRPLFLDTTRFQGLKYDFERETFVAETEDGKRFYMDCFGQWVEEIEPTPEPTETPEPTPTQKPPTPTQEPTQPPPSPTEVPPTPETPPSGEIPPMAGDWYFGGVGVCLAGDGHGLRYNDRAINAPGESLGSSTDPNRLDGYLRSQYYTEHFLGYVVPFYKARVVSVDGNGNAATQEGYTFNIYDSAIFGRPDNIEGGYYYTYKLSYPQVLQPGAWVLLAPRPNAEGIPDPNVGWAAGLIFQSKGYNNETCQAAYGG